MQKINYLRQSAYEGTFPEIKVGSAASRQKEILQALTNRERLLHKNDRIYELRMEDIVEMVRKMAACSGLSIRQKTWK